MDDQLTRRQVLEYLRQYQEEFNATLQNIPTVENIDAIKQEGFDLWQQGQREILAKLEDLPTKQDLQAIKEGEGFDLWQQGQREILAKLEDLPTKQDLQAIKEGEERLRKNLYLAIFTLAVLVFAMIVQIIRAYHISEAADLNDTTQHEMSDAYILGTLSDSWLHNHTDILLVSEQEGWVFLKHPIEFNMSTFTGYNNYLLQDSDAPKLQLDNFLQSVYITSSTKLFVFVHYGRQSDATFFIPVDKCAHEYTIPMHTFCENSSGKISLLAPYNDTEVTITLGQVTGSVEFNDKDYKSGDYMSVQVPRQKVMTIGHNGSLAGTTIYSPTPVCVLAGTVCKGGKTTCKSVITTVLPSSQLSRFFIVPNVVTTWSRLQLASTEDNNKVVINRYGNKEQQILKTSETYDMDLVGREPMVITSDRDIIVTVLARPTKTDPFLLWIVGVDQYRSSYQFYIPWYDHNFIHELYVICKTSQKNELRLNKQLLYPIPDSRRLFPVEDEEYEGFRLRANCCRDYVMEHKYGVKFGLYIYGYPGEGQSHYRSYGYPAGMFLR